MYHVLATPVPVPRHFEVRDDLMPRVERRVMSARAALREVAERARRKLNEVPEPSNHIADSLGHPLPDLR